MTPSELKEIREELGLSEAEFAAELDLPSADIFVEFRSGVRQISAALADRAERLQDDWRMARLILERKIQPQYEELLASGDKPARIALITRLDRDDPEHQTLTAAESRLSVFKQIDKLAKAYFGAQGVEVVSQVEFIKAPSPVPGDDAPGELSVLGVRVEALSS